MALIYEGTLSWAGMVLDMADIVRDRDLPADLLYGY
jgi:hypothetical protein